ncbi:ABC transporter substrate-binding protein [Eubacteriales bacterium OttesenSCG-928-A19]|nr:ABC transporter substrate-binding protein [Eubacteriales bacterium OttesenSCG-928-A19]
MKKVLSLLLSMMIVFAATSALAEILIGGIAPLTGPVSVYGIAVKNAADLYVNQINADGGVLGEQVRIEWLDDKHDPTEAVNAFYRLVDTDGIAAILGPVTSAPVLAVVEPAGDDGIPLLTPTGTSDVITEAGIPNVYRSCFKDSFQGIVMATFAAGSLDAKKVAVLYDNTSDYSAGIAENFVAEAAELGMEVVANEAGVATSGDFKAQLTNIAAAGPDAVFVPMYYNDVALIAQQAHEVGIEVPLLGVDGWDGILDVMEDTALLNGYFFCNHYAADDTNPKVVAFREAFEAAYGETPNALAALGYDGIAILLNAIEVAGSTDWDAINAALSETSYEGVTGTVKYEDSGDPANKAGVISVLEDGAIKFYERVEP